jgi:anti-sigma factor RsiW
MNTQWHDEILVAYVDGELDAETAESVSAGLAENPEARRKVEIFRSTRAMLRNAVGLDLPATEAPVLAASSIVPFRRTVHRWSRSRRLGAAIAACLALLVVGGTTGHYIAVNRGEGLYVTQDHWLEEMVRYYHIYAEDDSRLVELDASETDMIEAWFSRRFRREVQVPDLASAGLKFRGARLVAIETGAAAMLIYDSLGGKPLAFCMMPQVDTPDHAPTAERVADVDLVHWAHGGISFVLTGAADETTLRSIVKLVDGSVGKS